MTWWTASGALTALAAHDAAHAGGVPTGTTRATAFHAIAVDLLGGTNHLGMQAAPLVRPVATPEVSPSYQGIMCRPGFLCEFPYRTSVAFPTSGAAVVLMYINTNGFSGPIFCQDSSTTKFLLKLNGTTLQMGDLFAGPSVGASQAWKTFGVFWDASNFQRVYEGALYGSARAFTSAAIRPTAITGLGINTSYGRIYQTDGIAAAGLFSGTGSLAEVQAIETAMRTELVSPSIATAGTLLYDSKITSRVTNHHWEGATLAPEPTRTLLGGAFAHRYVFSGVSSISGVVTVEEVPASRHVFLFDKLTKICVADTWSAPGTGTYLFTALNPTREYFVWAEDNARIWNAVTQDMIVAS